MTLTHLLDQVYTKEVSQAETEEAHLELIAKRLEVINTKNIYYESA